MYKGLNWYTNILLEADKEQGDDYQLEETEDNTEESQDEELTAEDTSDDYQLEGQDEGDDGEVTAEGEDDGSGGDYELESQDEGEGGEVTAEGEDDGSGGDYELDGEGGDGEVTADDEGDSEDIDGEMSAEGMEDEETGEEDNTKKEKYKKMILLDDYREMYNIIINLQKSCENLNDRTNIKNKKLYNYLDRKIELLVEKISFTIRILFINEDYKKLLSLFYHYKIQINDIVKLFEFLIQSEEE